MIPLLSSIAGKRSRSRTRAGLTSGSAGALRNNYSNYVGFQFAPARNMRVSAIGIMKETGGTGNRTVSLFLVPNTQIATVTVDVTPGVAGQYVYTNLSAPVSLTAGTSYRIGLLGVFGGFQWREEAPVTSEADIGLTGSVYFDGTSWQFVGAARAYGPVNFLFA